MISYLAPLSTVATCHLRVARAMSSLSIDSFSTECLRHSVRDGADRFASAPTASRHANSRQARTKPVPTFVSFGGNSISVPERRRAAVHGSTEFRARALARLSRLRAVGGGCETVVVIAFAAFSSLRS